MTIEAALAWVQQSKYACGGVDVELAPQLPRRVGRRRGVIHGSAGIGEFVRGGCSDVLGCHRVPDVVDPQKAERGVDAFDVPRDPAGCATYCGRPDA